jgi:DnaJ-domain-containing protein 1
LFALPWAAGARYRFERNIIRTTADREKAPVMTVDPYAVLGLTPAATQAEITHAYRRQLRDHHPDLRSPEPDAPADQRLGEILAAYALLRDPARRAAYDRAHPVHRDAGPTRIAVTHDVPNPAHHDAGPTRIDVKHAHPTDEQPDLRAGPVRWHR